MSRFKRTFASAFTRSSLRVAIVAASIVLGASLYPSADTLAFSKRCPNDVLAQGVASPTETAQATDIWKKLHGSSLDGGDGPLGCPIGNLIDFEDRFKDQTYTFKGVGQEFQRGWIAIGRGDSAGSEIAIVRGWDTWIVSRTCLYENNEISREFHAIAEQSC